MISFLLLLPLLVSSDPAAPIVHAPSHDVEIVPVGMPNLVGRTIAEARTLMPGGYTLKIKDPVWGWRYPVPEDDPETVIKQTPPEGSPLPAPIPDGYFVGVIIDPGGEFPTILRVEKIVWAILVMTAFILLLFLWKGFKPAR